MEKRAKYAKLHPEMSNLDLTKILSKKYRELPDKKKVCQKAHSSTYFCDPCYHFSTTYNDLFSFYVYRKNMLTTS